jgi:hypothetical protein
MGQLLAGQIPRETEATCEDCAMCARPGQAEASEVFFDPRTKCCTYVPRLANFLVGRLLADDDPAAATGRVTVETRLRSGVGVTPLGLDQPATFQILYENTATNAFGRSPGLRCPHYLEDEGGHCGVWKHRASVCATWFCKYERGATGLSFWQGLHQLLSSVERALSQWCVLELEIDADALRRLFPIPATPGQAGAAQQRMLDDLVNREAGRALWGRWYDREADFYRECGRLVSGLSWDDVGAIAGPDVQVFARMATEAYGRLTSGDIPRRLKVGELNIVRMGHESCRVSTYCGSDPLDLPTELIDTLPYFDGRTTDQALRAIEAGKGLRIDRALIRRLVDFRILVPDEP